MSTPSGLRQEISETLGTVPGFIDEMPHEVQEPFWNAMRDLQLSETHIPNKYKQLIGLGIAAATKCPYCLHFHTEVAKLFGATPEEISETSALAMMSGGASAFIHGQQTDLSQFKKETAQIVDHVQEQMAQA